MLDYPYTDAALTHLMAFDNDAVNRWEAGQRLATGILLKGVTALTAHSTASGEGESADWIPDTYAEAIRHLLASAFAANGDPALVAEALVLPSETYLAEQMDIVDPDAIHAARLALRRHLAHALRDPLNETYEKLKVDAPYSPDNVQAGKRALRNICLSYLAELDDAASHARVLTHYEHAANMTDAIATLSALANLDIPVRHSVLDAFYAKWKHEALVVDKWLQVQATSRLADTGKDVRALMAHEAFDIRNPNKVYSLVRAFCAANPKHFHTADGSGYKLAADVILQLDPLNPQVASRIARCFDRWKKFDPARQAKARAARTRPRASGSVERCRRGGHQGPVTNAYSI